MRFFTNKQKETTGKPHYGDVVLWIEKNIETCQTVGQVRTAEKLIRLFWTEYQKDLTFHEMGSINKGLLRKSTKKWGQLMEGETKSRGKEKKRNEN